MKTNSKRIKNLKTFINKPIYNIDEGLLLIQKLNSALFLENLEIHISLNINSKNINQQVKGNLLLPNIIEKNKKIAVFTDESNEELTKLGASIVGYEDLLSEIRLGNINFDILLTNQKNMSKLSNVGRILGTKGLMPSLKNGTITDNFISTINEFNNGKINYKSDKFGVIHLVFGKSNFSFDQLKENLIVVLENINKNKPLGIKGKYLKTIYICTTMSPSIKLFNY
jgi:large subunit ribosomal protein L1